VAQGKALFVSTEKCGGDVASLWECTHARREERMHLAGYLVMLSLSAGRDHSIVVEG